MTDETRILRTVGIPIVVAIVLLFVMPKMCMRAVVVSKAQKQQAEQTATGFHIESTQKPVSYPAGLDPDRVRYLIEVDNRFSAPYTVHVFKTPTVGGTIIEQRMVPALRKLGYVEPGGDGTLTLTRDGLLHLDGLVDDGTSWTFPIAKRQFESVTSIDSDGGTAHANFAWQWQPTTVGAELMSSPRRHEAKADLANLGGHWSLAQITDLDAALE